MIDVSELTEEEVRSKLTEITSASQEAESKIIGYKDPVNAKYNSGNQRWENPDGSVALTASQHSGIVRTSFYKQMESIMKG